MLLIDGHNNVNLSLCLHIDLKGFYVKPSWITISSKSAFVYLRSPDRVLCTSGHL